MNLFKRSVLLVVMAAVGFLSAGCFGDALLRHPANAMYYWPNRSVIIADRYPSVYAVNGVHHLTSMEKIMVRGVVLADVGGYLALVPLVRDKDRLVGNKRSILSTAVSTDDYGNYVVSVRQDLGGYPDVIVPEFALGQVVGPVFSYTENAWNTESYIYAPDVPRTNRKNTLLATYMVPACSGTMLLLPTGSWEGFDFRWMHSGGPNPPTIIPDPGAGVIVSLRGWPVLVEVCEVVSRGPKCQMFRP